MDNFDTYTHRDMVWETLGDALTCKTTRGTYTIFPGGVLTFNNGATITRVGKFKDPKRAARRHFTEET